MAPHDVRPMVEKAELINPDVSLAIIERGNCFGYNNLVVDMRGFKIMHDAVDVPLVVDVPIVFDATHTVQYPQAAADSSGGDRSLTAPMALAAAATGYVDGLFVECHPDPDKALCDGPCMTKLDDMPKLIEQFMEVQAYGLKAANRSASPFQFNTLAGQAFM